MAKTTNPPNIPRRKLILFINTLLISFLAFSLFICIALVALRGFIITPPEIPAVKLIPEAEEEAPAFFTPEGSNEDSDIGGGLHAPEGFVDGDRKDLFYTFLIFGLDNGVNTDSIMLASYDGVNKAANIIGFPRDSKINVKRGNKKLNAAYPVGMLNGGGQDGGIAQLKREIKTIVGFVPDFYVRIDFKAFVEMVDAVGGIDVQIPVDMRLNDPEQDLFIDLKKGDRHLDGADALKFARYRKGQPTISDYQRIENQQTVIKSVLDRLLRPANLLKIPQFIEIFTEHVYTDIRPEHMLWFAEQLNEVRDSDALHQHTLPTSGTSGEPMYYEYIDKAAALELVNKTVNPFKKDIQAKDLDIAGE